MKPEQLLLTGCEVLNPVLVPHGFQFRLDEVGIGSGGHFAMGEYSRAQRALELHFRHSLGLVTYKLGSVNASHELMMRALHVQGQNEYPGFSEDPLDGFRHLARDLERYG